MSESAARGIAGLANYHEPTEEEREMLLRRTMRDVVTIDAKHNPQATTRDGLVTVVGAGVVQEGVRLASGEPMPNEPGQGNNWGYKLEAPRELSRSDQALIGKLCDAALGPVNRMPAMRECSTEELEGVLELTRQQPHSPAIAELIAKLEEELSGRVHRK